MNKLSKAEIGYKELTYFYNGEILTCKWFDKLPFCFEGITDIGIDQSSTSTGIAIETPSQLFMCTLERDELSVPLYKKAIKQQLHSLLSHCDLRNFTYEKHGVHITPVESVINEVTDSIKEFARFRYGTTVNTCGVLPPLWRSGFLNKDKYKNRFSRQEVKLACVEECCELVPELRRFIPFSGRDYDAFEAYGIMKGYKNLNYTEDGMRIVNRTMDRNIMRNTKHVILKCKNYEVESEIEFIQSSIAKGKAEIVKYNSDIFVKEAVNRVCGSYPEAIILYEPTQEFCRFVFDCGEPVLRDETFLVYCRRI